MLEIIVILLVTILPLGYYAPVSAHVPAYLPIFIRESYSLGGLPCNIAIPIRGVCSQIHSFAYLGHPLMATNIYQCGFLIYQVNCTTVYYAQVLAPTTSFTWITHDHYLDGEVWLYLQQYSLNICIQAGNNTNIDLAKTSAAVIGGVVFLTIVAAFILRRWKKQSTPYCPVSSPEVQMSYADHIIPTSITPEKISDFKVGEASSQEDELMGSIRRSSNSEVKRNSSRSTERRPVATHPILFVKETEDRSTEEEENYLPEPPRESPKVKRKSQRPSDPALHDVDTSMANIQGLGSASNLPASMGLPICTPAGYFVLHHASYCPICGHPFSRPCGSSDGSASPTDLGSPMYMTNPGLVPHCNPYHPTHGHPYPLPMVPYGYNTGGSGTNVNSGVGNITHVTISGISNNGSVDHAPTSPADTGKER